MSKPGTGRYPCNAGVKTFIFFLTSVPASYDIDLYNNSGEKIQTPVKAQIYRAWPPFYQEEVFTDHYHFVSVLDPGLTLYLTPLQRYVEAVIT
jgi:hypothetical protein